MLDQFETAVHHRHHLVNRAAGLKLQDRDVDQRGQEVVLAAGQARHSPPNRRQISRLKHRLLVLRQKVHPEESVLALRDPPSNEKFAKADEEDQMVEGLNGEGIREMREAAMVRQYFGAVTVLGKNDAQQNNESDPPRRARETSLCGDREDSRVVR